MNLHEAVKHLIKSFDDDYGVPQGVYIATRCLINSLWGMRAENVFVKYVKSADGRYYLWAAGVAGCMQEMQAAIVESLTAETE